MASHGRSRVFFLRRPWNWLGMRIGAPSIPRLCCWATSSTVSLSGHLHQQPQARRDVQTLLAAVRVDGLAVDVLHRQVGPAQRIHAGVVQARDVRVLQQRADVALARHALRQAVRPAQPRQLERHAALERTIRTVSYTHLTLPTSDLV